jgi:hypothetical protein
MVDGTIVRTCHECGADFDVTVDEQQFLQRICARDGRAYRLPANCLACRKARREQQYGPPRVVEVGDDQTLICCDCGTAFVFARDEQEWFRARGFAKPRRCRPCRRARTA